MDSSVCPPQEGAADVHRPGQLCHCYHSLTLAIGQMIQRNPANSRTQECVVARTYENIFHTKQNTIPSGPVKDYVGLLGWAHLGD